MTGIASWEPPDSASFRELESKPDSKVEVIQGFRYLALWLSWPANEKFSRRAEAPFQDASVRLQKSTLFGRIDQSVVREAWGVITMWPRNRTRNLEVQGLEERQLKETNIEVFEVFNL
jgi:hypothetical protein